MYQNIVSRLNDLFYVCVFSFFKCVQMCSLIKRNSFKEALN